MYTQGVKTNFHPPPNAKTEFPDLLHLLAILRGGGDWGDRGDWGDWGDWCQGLQLGNPHVSDAPTPRAPPKDNRRRSPQVRRALHTAHGGAVGCGAAAGEGNAGDIVEVVVDPQSRFGSFSEDCSRGRDRRGRALGLVLAVGRGKADMAHVA